MSITPQTPADPSTTMPLSVNPFVPTCITDFIQTQNLTALNNPSQAGYMANNLRLKLDCYYPTSVRFVSLAALEYNSRVERFIREHRILRIFNIWNFSAFEGQYKLDISVFLRLILARWLLDPFYNLDRQIRRWFAITKQDLATTFLHLVCLASATCLDLPCNPTLDDVCSALAVFSSSTFNTGAMVEKQDAGVRDDLVHAWNLVSNVTNLFILDATHLTTAENNGPREPRTLSTIEMYNPCTTTTLKPYWKSWPLTCTYDAGFRLKELRILYTRLWTEHTVCSALCSMCSFSIASGIPHVVLLLT